MLQLKIYANADMQMPEMTLTADNTVDLLEPYLLQSPMTGKYKGIFGRLNRCARYMKIPRWGVLRNKAFQSSAWLADQIVKAGLGQWIEFDAELFDPKAARKRKRIAAIKDIPQTEERVKHRLAVIAAKTPEEKAEMQAKKAEGISLHWKKVHAGEIQAKPRKTYPPVPPERRAEKSKRHKAWHASLTPEQRAEQGRKIAEGWAKSKKRREIEALKGEIQKIERDIPDWFVIPKGSDLKKKDA